MTCPLCSSNRSSMVSRIPNGDRVAIIFRCHNPRCLEVVQQSNAQLRREFRGPKHQCPQRKEGGTYAVITLPPGTKLDTTPTTPKPRYVLWGNAIPEGSVMTMEHAVKIFNSTDPRSYVSSNGKGDQPRPVDRKKFSQNFDRAFTQQPKRQTFKPQPKAK